MKINKKAALQMSFQWIFSIIVGIFILFLAIYGVTKILQAEQTVAGAKTGKNIGILLNPLETGFETGRTTPLTMPVETRIYSTCEDFGQFGEQKIHISQKSFNKWTETDIEIGFSNKYIFSANPVQGKTFYIFSKPFEFPFKVTDLIYLTSSEESYCFVNAPESIEEELLDLKQENLLIRDCTGDDIRICFGFTGCDIGVNYGSGYVEKNGERVYFETDALMYAAIFADAQTYECGLKRIIQRLQSLALLYKDKSVFLAGQQACVRELDSGLMSMSNFANTFEDSADISNINNIVQELENKNDFAKCKLW